jgi:hypothetical protein
MTDAELDAVEARANAATKGPWRVDEMDMYIFGGDGHMVASNCPTEDRWQVRGAGAEGSGQRPAGSQDANAEFIAKAREDVPALVAELRIAMAKLQALVEQWRAYPGEVCPLEKCAAALEAVLRGGE